MSDMVIGRIVLATEPPPQAARAGWLACSECGAGLLEPTASGCCSARCRAAKSRRTKRARILAAVAALDRARAELAAALED